MPDRSLDVLTLAGFMSAAFVTGLVIGWVRRGEYRRRR